MLGQILSGISGIFGGDAGKKAGNVIGSGLAAGMKADQAKYLGSALHGLKGQEQARFDPYATQGTQANSLIASLLGLGGGTGGAEALDKFRDSTGYRDTMNAALGGVTSNAAARGLLNSSGTGKTFQNTAAQIAQGSFGDFLQQLMGQQQVGLNAAGAQAELGANLGANAAQATALSKGQTKGILGSLFGG